MKTRFICLGLSLVSWLCCNAQYFNDLDAQDYIYNANITDLKERTAIVKLCRALKYYGIWDNIHALYLPTGSTQLSHSLNVKDPRPDEGAYPLIFPNGATHTSAGVSFNGIDQGAMSLYRAVSTRLHLMVYQPEPVYEPFIFSGDRSGLSDFYAYTWSALYTNGYIGFANTAGINYTQASDRTGFFYGQRINHDSTQGFVNGTLVDAWATPVTPYYNTDTAQFIWLNKTTQFADFRGVTKYSVASIGNSMEDGKVAAYYRIIQSFLSELGIQVGAALDWPVVPDDFETDITSNYRWHKATENAVDTAIDGVHLYSIGDSLYLWGGWNGNWYPFDFNTGYVSGDGGVTWQSTGQAPWNVRHSAAYGQDSSGRGYLVGSDVMPEATPENRKEVWRTRNGRDWRLKTNNAPWSGNLVLEGLAIKGNTLYVGGGQFGANISEGMNDTIWKSEDGGSTWMAINNNASHLGGILYNNFKFFKARNKFVAFCGGKYDSDPAQRVFSSQVWVSDDCLTWTREKDVPFEPRMYSDMVEWDDKLWVFGGDRPALTGQGTLNLRGLWYMDKKGDWHEAGCTPLPPRHASGLTVDRKNDRLVIACGNMHSDVWYLEKLQKGPKFNLPLSRQVPLTESCTAIVPDLGTGLVNDSIVQVTQSPVAGTSFSNSQAITASVTAKDLQGNEKTQFISLVPVDTIAPVFSVQDTAFIYLNASGRMIIPNLTDTLKGSDNCGTVSFYQVPSAGVVIDSLNGIKNIRVVAADEHDNTTSHFVVVKIVDTIPPVLSAPDTVSIASDTGCNITVPNIADSVKSFDNAGAVSLSQAPGAGTILPVGGNKTLNLAVTALDRFGNTATRIIVVKIVDTIPPKIISPGPQTVYIGNNCQAVVPDLQKAGFASVCGQITIEQTPKAGSVIDAHADSAFTIVLTATDNFNNTSTAMVTVAMKDTTAPVFGRMNDISVAADTNKCGAHAITSLPPVYDNCKTVVTGNRSDGLSLDAIYPVGNTVITWKAVDAAGNMATLVQAITVTDQQPPAISVPSEIELCYSNSHSYSIPVATATDNCGVKGFSYKITGATIRSGNSNDASGTFNPGLSTIVWTAKDINGNEVSGTSLVKIRPPFEVIIPDVPAFTQGAEPNTLYIGYGPSALVLTASVSQTSSHYYWSNGNKTKFLIFSAASPGLYSVSVVVEGAGGCSDSATKQLKVVDLRCNETGVSVCQKSGSQVLSSCVDSFKVASLLRNGAYLGSCRNSDTAQNILDSIYIKIIPNPSSYAFRLLVPNPLHQPVSLRVFNSMGQMLEEKQLASESIDMSFGKNYDPGIYFAEITRGFVKKVVKLIKTN